MDAKIIKSIIGADKFEALKQAFGVKQSFLTVVATDGTSLQVDKLEKGASVQVVTEQGTKPADSGKYGYTDDNGTVWTMVVDNGIISDITEGAETPETPAAAVATPSTATESAIAPETGNNPTAMANMEKELADLKAEFALLKTVFETEQQPKVEFGKANESLKSQIAELEAKTKQMMELVLMIGEMPTATSNKDEEPKTVSFKSNNPQAIQMEKNIEAFRKSLKK